MPGLRAHRDPSVVVDKLRRLSDPHVAPLTRYVERLRARRGGGEAVPRFDPAEAGVDAPDHRAPRGAWSTSNRRRRSRPASARAPASSAPTNNDATAANMWSLLQAAQIDRDKLVVTWNVVPWYVSDGDGIRAATTTDITEGRPALLELLGLTGKRCGALTGPAANG